MASSRIAKFITEVAPPQYISVMRHRASKMLDTINEEERDVSPSNSLASAPSHMVLASEVAQVKQQNDGRKSVLYFQYCT
ncbi:hypothetical protein RCOM_0596970 [Ricinus communis]|uniref:Uncharacterized protein n=1 Tax=Ricinus communis TaxID=3988 RepID=B9SIZ3_RICCO|nr:hypothetical protein RCOM_0596970 [Ricinus communis]